MDSRQKGLATGYDRFDVVEAHAVLEWDYNVGGWLQERPSNSRQMRATAVQLHRMGFRARLDLCFDTLSDDAKTIYLANVLRYKLPFDDEQLVMMKERFTEDCLAQFPVEKKAFSGMYETLH